MVLSNHDLALVDNKFSKPDLLDIVNHLKPKLGDKWQDIASVLKIPYSQIREIEKNPTLYGSHSAYLREVLHCWEIGEIDGKPYKWSTILRTLEHPSVGCSGVALEIFRNLMGPSVDHYSSTNSNSVANGSDENGMQRPQDSEDESSKFSCTCGKCSLKDYLSLGVCKNPNVTRVSGDYPVLNVAGMSIEEKECLLNKLDKDVRAVQKKFSSLTLALKKSLVNYVEHCDLALFVSGLTVYDATKANYEKTFADIIPEIFECDSISKIFLILSNYWSWINYDLLQDIVDGVGNDSDKANIEKYKSDTLKPFLEKSLSEIPVSIYGRFRMKNFQKLVFKIGTDMESHSASSARRIKEKIAHHFGLEYRSILLARIEEGCLQITFLIPQIVIDTMFPLTQELQSTFSVIELEGKRIESIATSDHNYDLKSQEGIPLDSIRSYVRGWSRMSEDYDSDSSSVNVPPGQTETYKLSQESENSSSGYGSSSTSEDEKSRSSSFIQNSGSESMSDDDKNSISLSISVNPKSTSTIASKNSFSTQPERHLGVSSICKRCLHKGINCNHDSTQNVTVTWDKHFCKWIQIRRKPNFLPRQHYNMCPSYPRCNGDRCTGAHGALELFAWNFDLKKSKIISLDEPPVSSHWQSKFLQRLKMTTLRVSSEIKSGFTPENYKRKFYYLLCFEEKEHITQLTKKCDGRLNLQLYSQPPEFLASHKPVDEESIDEREVLDTYGYISGDALTTNEIEYATQASEALFFVQFDDKSKKSDICRVRIHRYNFESMENKLYLSFPSRYQKQIETRCKRIGDATFAVDVEFEVKHYYFNTLHGALVKLPDWIIAKLLPKSPDQFKNFHLEFFDWYNPGLSFLHLDYKSQFLALQRIVSCPSDVPFILSGPFGSGKTRVLACAAYYFASVKHKEPARIMICAHHQESTETFVHAYFGRLFKATPGLSQQIQVIHIVRGKSAKKYGTYMYSYLYKSVSEFQEWWDKRRYDPSKPLIVIATYMNSLSLYELLQVPAYGFFTHFLLDEAAQVREPEAIAPLALATRDAKIVMAGDNLQVGPETLVFGQEATEYGLNVSLLERLVNLYRNSFREPSKAYHMRLDTIYRCHEKLLHLPSKLFYDGSLKLGPRHPSIHKGPTGYKFISKSLQHSGSHQISRNEEEAHLLLNEVVSYVSRMKSDDPYFKEFKVGIISSSRSQLNILKNLIKKDGRYSSIRRVKILPSYLLQGHEFKAIFLSLSGSLTAEGVIYHETKSLCNPIVFNTVITRAMNKVVAVGDPRQLLLFEAKSKFEVKPWSEFLKACLKEKTLVCFDIEEEKEVLQHIKSM